MTGRREVGQGGAGRGKTEWVRDNADSDSNTGRYQGAGAPNRYIFCRVCFLSTHLFYSPSSFWLPLFSQSAIIDGPGRNVTNTLSCTCPGHVLEMPCPCPCVPVFRPKPILSGACPLEASLLFVNVGITRGISTEQSFVCDETSSHQNPKASHT